VFLNKRNGIYYLWFINPHTGKKSKISTGSTTKVDAYKFMRDFHPGSVCKKMPDETYLLAQFQHEFLEYSQSVHTPKTCACVKTAFEQLIRVSGNIALRDVTIRHIEKFVAFKLQETSAWTARKHFAHLASAFERALVWRKIEANPFRSVPNPKTPERIPIYFTHEQLSLLLEVIDKPDFLDLVIMAIMTGMRMGEMINLHWHSVDLERETIIIENTSEFTTKSKRNRLVPINKHLLPILVKRKKEATNDLVFHRSGTQFSTDYVTKRFKKYVRRATLDDRLHFHSLRHSTASFLVQAGVPIYTVKELLGHSQLSTTQVYSHLSGSQLMDSANQISLPNQKLQPFIL
jgi:site-specific recombinase XerD